MQERLNSVVPSKAGPCEDHIAVPLSDVLHLLEDAVALRRTWLRDFADDQIMISSDLYQTIMAYQYYRRPAA